MSPAQGLVFATISAAVLSWAAAEIVRSRALWTAGAALALLHAVAAFGVFYGWSHETARLLTMQQTETATGIQFAGGIYINYALLALWLADAAWWWTAPRSYMGRASIVSVLIRGFIFFIIVNGAVVFADGWARVIGLVASLAVVISWSLKHWLR